MNFNIYKTPILMLAIACALVLTSCNDSFLEKYPETAITEKMFFKSVKDLETYTNGLYNFGASYSDIVSDNVIYNDESSIYGMMRGELDQTKADGWGWSRLRSINFMLARVEDVPGDVEDVNHFIGIARLFRALEYYGKVKIYNDVPWYDKDLQTADKELLYKAQDSREFIVDKIMEDMAYAVEHIKEGTSKTRLVKNTALAFQARLALEEGTFRKYHPELELNDGDRFLKLAVESAKKIIDGDKYSLTTMPLGTMPAYTTLFSSEDLSNNTEILMFADYDRGIGRLHGAGAMFNWTHTLSRDLMEDYLVLDTNGKAIPYHQIPNYDKKIVTEIFENRDPRMEQTMMKPGFMRPGDTKPARQNLSLGGYPQVKYTPTTQPQLEWGKAYTDLPIIRYAEILLLYAEAKAELGVLTQADLDMTINLIRERVAMPTVTLNELLTNIDPVQEKRYSNVKSSQKGAVLEIRRERRIELACEGTRYNDLMRWSLGKLMEPAPQGIYLPAMGLYDITGDGKPDVAVAMTKDEMESILATLTEEEKKEYQLTTHVLEGNTFSLTNKTSGHIRMNVQIDKWKFEEPKYYYRPIAQIDLNVNRNLVQNKYWKQ